MVGFGDQIQQGHALELVQVLVAEHLEVGLVGVDVHAILAVTDGLARAFDDGAVLVLHLVQRQRHLLVFAALLGHVQLTLDRGRQPRRLAFQHHVVRAVAHDLDQVRIADVAGDDEEGNVEMRALDQVQRQLRAEMRERVFRQHHVPGSLVERRLHGGEVLHALILEHEAGLAQRGHGQLGVIR